MSFLLVLVMSFLSAFANVEIEDHSLIYDSYALEKQGKLVFAIDRMKKVAITEGDNYFVQMRLGHLYVANKDVLKASAYFIKAAELKPKAIEPWLILARLFNKSGEEVKTKNFAYEVLKRAPYHRGAALLFVKAAVTLRSHADGLDQTNEILSAFPNDDFFLEKKAFFLSNLARKQEAKQVITELLLVNPDNEYARKFLAKEK